MGANIQYYLLEHFIICQQLAEQNLCETAVASLCSVALKGFLFRTLVLFLSEST